MTFLEICLLIAVAVLVPFSIYVTVMLYRLGIIMLNVEDTLENSLDIVDDRIDAIQNILEVPLFSDSPEIKKIHNNMQTCRDALLDIANALTKNINDEEEALEVE